MRHRSVVVLLVWLAGAASAAVLAQGNGVRASIDGLADQIEPRVIEWRRDFHRHPELSNREFRTAKIVAEHLRRLGLEVQTGIAHTGVVGVLRGGKPGPVVALRADMDGLPVTERTPVPFASTVRSKYRGRDVGVMHACGHDTHVAILMGVAEILASVREALPGTVKFIFQPAEEGAPPGEEGGAKLMIQEGVLENPAPEVIFGLHISAQEEVGKIRYRAGGTMAAADRFTIRVKGKQTHGSTPWSGVDPIVVAAQIINGLQTVVSRQVDLTEDAAVVTVGMIHGGVRNNIIPEEVEMVGTIRTLNQDMQRRIHERIRRTAVKIAESAGAEAEVEIQMGVPVTYNDPDLVARMLPGLQAVAGKDNVVERAAITGAEDFSFFQEKIPGFYFFLGGMPKGREPAETAPHHTPDFYVDESGLKLGVRALCRLTLDYLEQHGTN